MGNAILKEYNVNEEQVVASGGIGKFWKIYDATNKKTLDKVSVHILQKDNLPKHLRTETFYDLIRREGSILIRIRHPFVLRLLHQLDESKKAFVLVTEPVTTVLSTTMLPSTKGVVFGAPVIQQDDQQVKNGIRQITQALLFLHETAKFYHAFVDPCNIYITPTDDWKLAGFYISSAISRMGELVKNRAEYSEASPLLPFLTYAYVAPEIVLEQQHDHLSDGYSLARIVQQLSLFRTGHPLLETFVPVDLYHYKTFVQDATSSSSSQQQRLVDGLEDPSMTSSLLPLLTVDHATRGGLDAFLASGYFTDIISSTLRFLDALLEQDVVTRVDFLKQLPGVLSLFSDQLSRKKILPALLLQLKDEQMASFVLPSLFLIIKTMDRREFSTAVQGSVLGFMTESAVQSKPDTVFFFISHLELLLKLCTPVVHSSHVVPMLCACLTCEHLELQEQALQQLVTPCLERKFEYSELKEMLLPRVHALCIQTDALAIRLHALLCLNSIFVLFDLLTIESVVLHAVDECVETGKKDVAVIMCCVGLYDGISKHMGKSVTASRLLPAVSPLVLLPVLNAAQYQTVVGVLVRMVERIQAQSAALEQRDYIKHQSALQREGREGGGEGGGGGGGGIDGTQVQYQEEGSFQRSAQLSSFQAVLARSSAPAPARSAAANNTTTTVAAAAVVPVGTAVKPKITLPNPLAGISLPAPSASSSSVSSTVSAASSSTAARLSAASPSTCMTKTLPSSQSQKQPATNDYTSVTNAPLPVAQQKELPMLAQYHPPTSSSVAAPISSLAVAAVSTPVRAVAAATVSSLSSSSAAAAFPVSAASPSVRSNSSFPTPALPTTAQSISANTPAAMSTNKTNNFFDDMFLNNNMVVGNNNNNQRNDNNLQGGGGGGGGGAIVGGGLFDGLSMPISTSNYNNNAYSSSNSNNNNNSNKSNTGPGSADIFAFMDMK